MASLTAQRGAAPHTLSQIGSGVLSPQLENDVRSNVPRGDVEASLNFYFPPADGAVPFNYVESPPEGQPQRNYSDATHTVTIHDIRGHEDEFSPAQNAFGVAKGYPHNEAINWDSDESVKQHYYPEVERVLRTHLESSDKENLKIVLFDHTIRRAKPGATREPVTKVHIDQSAKAAAGRVIAHLGEEEGGKVLDANTRYRIVNVWRPLNGAVESFPLAFADARTISSEDTVAVEHRYPNKTGETVGVKHAPTQRWHYYSGIDNDERILLQCFDSENQRIAGPHTAFVDSRSRAVEDGGKPRESIEVRALIIG